MMRTAFLMSPRRLWPLFFYTRECHLFWVSHVVKLGRTLSNAGQVVIFPIVCCFRQASTIAHSKYLTVCLFLWSWFMVDRGISQLSLLLRTSQWDIENCLFAFYKSRSSICRSVKFVEFDNYVGTLSVDVIPYSTFYVHFKNPKSMKCRLIGSLSRLYTGNKKIEANVAIESSARGGRKNKKSQFWCFRTSILIALCLKWYWSLEQYLQE